jgi:hypothetical protein
MRLHLKQVISLWFVLQIILPFTAPLQTCDLQDLLGTKDQHSAPLSPESSTTPTTSESEADANTFVSPVDTWALRASTDIVVADNRWLSGPLMSAFGLSPSPQVQRTVLRL